MNTHKYVTRNKKYVFQILKLINKSKVTKNNRLGRLSENLVVFHQRMV